MKKIVLTAGVVLMAVAIAATAVAFNRGRGPGNGFGEGVDFRILSKLGLTEDQQAKLKSMRDAERKEIEPIREQMWVKRDELRKLWLEPNPDQEKIAAATREMRSLRDQIEDRMTALRLDSLKVLTPEQQEKMRSFGARRGGFGPGPGRGHGFDKQGWGNCPGTRQGPGNCAGGFGGDRADCYRR